MYLEFGIFLAPAAISAKTIRDRFFHRIWYSTFLFGSPYQNLSGRRFFWQYFRSSRRCCSSPGRSGFEMMTSHLIHAHPVVKLNLDSSLIKPLLEFYTQLTLASDILRPTAPYCNCRSACATCNSNKFLYQYVSFYSRAPKFCADIFFMSSWCKSKVAPYPYYSGLAKNN